MMRKSRTSKLRSEMTFESSNTKMLEKMPGESK